MSAVRWTIHRVEAIFCKLHVLQHKRVRCRRYTKCCWVGKLINVTMKPTNSPTQGHPNPRTIRLKVTFRPLFFVDWGWFYVGNRLQATGPNQILRKHPIYRGTY